MQSTQPHNAQIDTHLAGVLVGPSLGAHLNRFTVWPVLPAAFCMPACLFISHLCTHITHRTQQQDMCGAEWGGRIANQFSELCA